MDVTLTCPACEGSSRLSLEGSGELSCPHCARRLGQTADGSPPRRIEHCLVCGSDDLFIRKDFSQRLGLTIIIAGFLASSVAWYFYMKYLTFGILFATALVDVLLYVWVDNLLQCYRCHAEYRGVDLESHEPFHLETHERHRQQRARLGSPQSPSTAPAPAAAPDQASH